MTPVVKQPPAAPPTDPVGAALGDPEVRSGLLDHARATLGRWLADRPAAVVSEACVEAVQETQLRAIQKRREYDAAAGSASAWLHGIMLNVLRETARSFRRAPAQEPADAAAWERLTADRGADAAEALSNLLAAAHYLNLLPAGHREVMRLRFSEELSHDEIAARLGISPGAARVRLSRALAAAKVIAGVGPGEDRR